MPRKKNEIKSWEIVLPSPFVLDKKIKDEDIIDRMLDASTESEASAIISSAFETAHNSFTIECTKEELFKLLTIEEDIGLTIELQEYDDMYVFNVSDETNAIIGRGEIYESGKKVSKTVFRKHFLKNFDSFKERYIQGQKRINNLAYKLKIIRTSINSAPPSKSDLIN